MHEQAQFEHFSLLDMIWFYCVLLTLWNTTNKFAIKTNVHISSFMVWSDSRMCLIPPLFSVQFLYMIRSCWVLVLSFVLRKIVIFKCVTKSFFYNTSSLRQNISAIVFYFLAMTWACFRFTSISSGFIGNIDIQCQN